MSQEAVPHSTNNVSEILAFMDSNEALGDPILRRDYFEHMDGDGFIDFLQQTASVVRTGDSEARQAFDGEKVALMGHEVPDQREKQSLLYETWDVAQKFLHDRNLSDEDALERAALAVAGGVLLAHPFIDGNGRTSRISSYLIARGPTDEATISGIVGRSSGTGGWEVAPVALKLPARKEYKGSQPDDIDWEFHFAGEGEDALGGVVANSLYDTAVLREFIESQGHMIDSQLNNCTQEVNGKRVLNADKFLEEIVTDKDGGIANAEEILGILRKQKATSVRRYLQALLVESRTSLVHSISPIEGKAYEELHIRDRIVAKYLGENAVNGMLTPMQQQVLQHRKFSTIHRSELEAQESKVA